MPTVQDALDRIWSDEGLKKRLIESPKPVLAEFGLKIPDSVSVEIHENSPSVMNAVLPKKPADGAPLGGDPVSKTMERAWSDPAFKARLLADPKEAAAEQGVRLPDTMALKIWENTDTVEHMVLPVNPAESELSDADLEAVAGGGLSKGVQVATGCGLGAAAAGIGGAALAFTAVGAAIGFGIAGGLAGAGSAAGGAIASGGSKC
jgi:hypothetical protein